MEKYLAAKAKLFQALGQNVRKKRGKYAIINNDDPVSQQLAEMTSVPVITYGMKNKADVRAEQVKVTAAGVSYQLRYKEQLIPVNLKLTGVFNVYNSLAAISVGLVENIPISSIINSLERIPGISGRLEKVEAGQDFTVIVDYCHTPDGLDNCLRTAREIAEGVQNSCNPVFSAVGLRMGKETFYRYLDGFGFGKKTGISLPGEAIGIIVNKGRAQDKMCIRDS